MAPVLLVGCWTLPGGDPWHLVAPQCPVELTPVMLRCLQPWLEQLHVRALVPLKTQGSPEKPVDVGTFWEII